VARPSGGSLWTAGPTRMRGKRAAAQGWDAEPSALGAKQRTRLYVSAPLRGRECVHQLPASRETRAEPRTTLSPFCVVEMGVCIRFKVVHCYYLCRTSSYD
jgi:hypothetical protein